MTFIPTIFALSTPPGRGALAVVRVSGPAALSGLEALTRKEKPLPRQACVRAIRDPRTEKEIDSAVVFFFNNPASFTGEDMVEYHVHGGWSIIQSLLTALAEMNSYRMAEPGEFTRRAFENGKIDLTGAEAIADLIDAETESQRLAALGQLRGSLSKLYTGWVDQLVHTLALMEADLDFSDQDLPDDLLLRVKPDLSDLVDEIRDHLNDNRRGERLRNGFKITILGAPNSGKSSLINILSQRELAIVSPVAGTTRDVIEAHLDIGGLPVILADTAGLRFGEISQDGHDAIETEGMRRALGEAETADLKILVFDGTLSPDAQTLNLLDESSIVVANKKDLWEDRLFRLENSIPVSTLTHQGIADLLKEIETRLKFQTGQRTSPSLTRARHRAALEKTLFALERAMTAQASELAAEDVRLAVRHLGTITGKVDVEDLLDIIFRDFCIGK